MALLLNDSTKTNSFNIKTQSIVEKLKTLDCHFLGNEDTKWLEELLYQPGMNRIHLLQWLYKKINPSWTMKEGSIYLSEEAQIQDTLTLLSAAGLCKKSDKDFITGEADLMKQVKIWHLIVDLATTNLDKDLQCNSSLLDTLITQVDYKALLSSDLNIFPPDLKYFKNQMDSVELMPSENQLQYQLEELQKKKIEIENMLDTASQGDGIDANKKLEQDLVSLKEQMNLSKQDRANLISTDKEPVLFNNLDQSVSDFALNATSFTQIIQNSQKMVDAYSSLKMPHSQILRLPNINVLENTLSTFEESIKLH